jgi:hypothetical protein
MVCIGIFKCGSAGAAVPEFVKRPSSSRRVLQLFFFLLSAVQVAALFVALERPAQAYVDPGSGFVLLQVAGSMFAGAVYYMRHRLKRILNAMGRSSQISSRAGTQTGVVRNQPKAGHAKAFCMAGPVNPLAWAIPELGKRAILRQFLEISAKVPLLEFVKQPKRTELEVNIDFESINREVRQRFKDGKNRGETEVEITTRLVWLERQKHYALCNAMEEIFRGAADALDLLQQKNLVTPLTCSNGTSL